MRTIEPEDPVLRRVNLDDVIAYLNAKNWQRIEYPREALLVFQGPNDDEGMPIKAVLTRDLSYEDSYKRLAETISLLAAMEDRDPVSLARELAFNEVREKEKRLAHKYALAASVAAAFFVIGSVGEVYLLFTSALPGAISKALLILLGSLVQLAAILVFIHTNIDRISINFIKKEKDYFYLERDQANYSLNRK